MLASRPAGRCDHDVPLAPLYFYESARSEPILQSIIPRDKPRE